MSGLSRAQTRAILEATPDGVIVTDVDGRIVTLNSQAEAMFGYARDALRGKPVEALIPGRFREAHRRHRKRYRRAPATRPMGTGLDLYGLRADGSEFPVDIGLSVVPGRRGPLVVAIVRDVTERRRAEEQLAAQNAVLQRIATGEPLERTLEAVCQLVERDRAGAACAILLRSPEDRRLRFSAGARLPASLRGHLDVVPVGARFGPCAAAVRSGKPVAVRDFAADAHWKRLARTALAAGFRSCIAIPVQSPGGPPLGAAVVFQPHPAGEGGERDELFEVAVNLIRLAVEHERADRELEESRRRLETLVDNLPGMVYRCLNDPAWTMEWVSRGCLALTGYRQSDLTRGRVAYGDLIDPEDRQRVWDEVQQAIAEGRPFQLIYRIRARDGQQRWVWERGRGVFDGTGKLVALEGFIADVTANRKAEEERARLAEILEATTDIVGTADASGRVRYLNAAGRRLLGIEGDEDLASRTVGDLLPERLHALVERDVVRAATREGVWRGESVIVSKDGQEIPISQVVIAHRRPDGSVEFFSTVARDISEQKRFEAQLLHAANHDPLTGLANRRRFEEDLERELARLRTAGGQAALLFLDLDDFKAVNDSLGHRAGDEALASVAGLLSGQLPPPSVVARVGGDEFGILLPDTSPSEARAIARRLLDALRQHAVFVEGHVVRTTASVGMAVLPDHGESAGEALAHADLALFEAKERGRNAFAIYSRRSRGQAASHSRLHWRRRLAEALEGDRLVLHAQPIVNLATREAEQYELLLRIQNDDGSLALPASFLGVAERFGLIRDIDRAVVQRAIRLLPSLDERAPGARLSVNLSGRAFADEQLVPLIRRELASSGVDPSRLVLEITETAAIRDLSEAQKFVRSLKSLGCQFALDDFGVGFASFSHLKHLAVDYVKIDGSFIRHLTRDDVDQHVVRALVEVAKGLGCATVAEFVTDEETVRLLQTLGVDYGQGFYLGEPAPLGHVGERARAVSHRAA
jgi:diguanylate cyclase (GGDEF)-like protein/PAS domain S-box-containing protein